MILILQGEKLNSSVAASLYVTTVKVNIRNILLRSIAEYFAALVLLYRTLKVILFVLLEKKVTFRAYFATFTLLKVCKMFTLFTIYK